MTVFENEETNFRERGGSRQEGQGPAARGTAGSRCLERDGYAGQLEGKARAKGGFSKVTK